jgi:hypothetical protein
MGEFFEHTSDNLDPGVVRKFFLFFFFAVGMSI